MIAGVSCFQPAPCQVSTPDELLQAALLPAEKIISNQSRSFYLLILTLLDESFL